MLTHLTGISGTSACGIRIPEGFLTTIRDEVSCLSCQRCFGNIPRSYTNKRNTLGYGDAQFPGTGFLHCFHCDRPIREHPIARVCPFPPAERLTPNP